VMGEERAAATAVVMVEATVVARAVERAVERAA